MAQARSLLLMLRRLGKRGLEELARALGLSAADGPRDGSLHAGIPAAPGAQIPTICRIPSEPPGGPAPEAIAAMAGSTWVVFLPRDPHWAFIYWQIAPGAVQQMQAAGATDLCLMIVDVTDLDGDDAPARALQEVVVEIHATEWYLPLPMSDRDYRVELGYRKARTGSWTSLAFSAPAHMPAAHPSERPLDTIEPFSIHTVAALDMADGTLHERLYQRATSLPWWYGWGSEAIHEGNRPPLEAAGKQASGVGGWASGRRESGAGAIPPRRRSFWLMVDAELIIYGATNPAASLTVRGEALPLSEDGTFRIQIPFPNGPQSFPIAALAADGQQRRRITMTFHRQTPHSGGNCPDETRPEWF